MIRNTTSMYSGGRSALRKPLAIAAAAVACLAAPACALAGGQGHLAAAGQKVAGLTLTTTQTPTPLPTTLPTGHPYRPPAGKLFQGVADKPVSTYVQTVGKHPSVYQ